jgi:16S rRNA pseudouridine516 synthase
MHISGSRRSGISNAGMTLIKYLSNLGYGSRREVTALVAAGRVSADGGRRLSADDTWAHASLQVDGQPLDPAPGALLMLHKPVGYVCSTRDVPPLIYEMMPARFLRRTPIMAPVGRLDRDTSGLLLLTDDGTLNHRLTSPRVHVPKTYRVTVAHDFRGDEREICAAGTLLLAGEQAPLLPATLVVLDRRTAELTITEGRYHQVRRMCAALGNHAVALHRTAIGGLTLAALPTASWRVVEPAERLLLDAATAPRSAP